LPDALRIVRRPLVSLLTHPLEQRVRRKNYEMRELPMKWNRLRIGRVFQRKNVVIPTNNQPSMRGNRQVNVVLVIGTPAGTERPSERRQLP